MKSLINNENVNQLPNRIFQVPRILELDLVTVKTNATLPSPFSHRLLSYVAFLSLR